MKQIFDWLREQFNEDIEWYKTHGINKDFNRGIIGEANKGISLVDEAEAKLEADVCEWQETERLRQKGICYGSDGLYKPSCNNDEDDFRDWNWIRHFKYCPYCGKRIKISEVE